MAEFTIKIAGRNFGISSLFESTRDYCRAYLTEEEPEVILAVSREDLAFAQAELLEEARQEGFRPRVFTDPFLDRAAIQRKVAEHLLDSNTLMLHGSAVAVDGEGYLFMAKSGTGKSTHTRYWRQIFGDRAVMVNDDKPFFRVTETEVLVCGAPWSGKHGLDANLTVPLKGICILTRGTENRIRKIGAGEAEGMLFWQSSPPLDPKRKESYERLLKSLLEKTTFWKMECTKDPQAAVTAYEAMSGN